MHQQNPTYDRNHLNLETNNSPTEIGIIGIKATPIDDPL